MRNYDHTYTDEIVCPHCGHILINSQEYEDNDGIIECGNCEKPFSYCREISVTYSTYKEEYEICPRCNKEEVLEDISRYPSSLKHTNYKKLCKNCRTQVRCEAFKNEN